MPLNPLFPRRLAMLQKFQEYAPHPSASDKFQEDVSHSSILERILDDASCSLDSEWIRDDPSSIDCPPSQPPELFLHLGRFSDHSPELMPTLDHLPKFLPLCESAQGHS